MSKYTTRQILDMIEANEGPEGLDLSRKDLSGIDLGREAIEAELGKALKSAPGETPVWYSDLTGGIKLVEAQFGRANLRLANLEGADLSRADLRANLRRAVLSGANLIEANLSMANLTQAHLKKADLSGAGLNGAILNRADLSEANLSGAGLMRADLSWANLSGANLEGAALGMANLTGADLSKADLRSAYLVLAQLVHTNLSEANLASCLVFGVSAWGLNLSGAIQSNLVITSAGEPTITVDNLEVAQFIYLLLNNEKIRNVINTITTKVVLILGSFKDERKAVLDAIRDELRKSKYDYVPVMFDFEKPPNRDFTETVRTLAHLARFIIADITEPRSVSHELQAIVPDLAVPVQPLLLEGSTGEYGMFQDLKRKYHWVLAVHEYRDFDDLLASLAEKVIAPAEAKAKELEKR